MINLTRRRITIAAPIFAISSYFLATTTLAQAEPKVQEISIEEVARHLEAKTAHVFDANSPEQFADGHVPGAVHLPFDKVTLAELPKDKAANVIFYCWARMCSASHAAATKAAQLGFSNVYVMRDGITGWSKAGKPVEKS